MQKLLDLVGSEVKITIVQNDEVVVTTYGTLRCYNKDNWRVEIQTLAMSFVNFNPLTSRVLDMGNHSHIICDL